MDGLILILGFFSFWLGACIASFLNVVIWRVPRGESIVSPPSHCPKCNAPIHWYQNIPIVAWLALRGKCANCKAPISPRYILIEILGGCVFLAAFLHYLAPALMPGATDSLTLAEIELLVMWIWISLMIIGSFIDYDLQLLPDFVTVGGMILGVVYNGVFSAFLCYFNGFPHSLLQVMAYPITYSLLGLAFGFGLLWFVRWLGSLAFKREAMGMGDVFLMGAIGALFGPVAVVVVMILSSVLGSVIGIGLMLASKVKLGKFVAIPFGPYICIACFVYMMYGDQIVSWYLSLLGVK